MANTNTDKLFGGDALGAYAMRDVESVAGMLQSGSISVIWSLAELQDFFGVTGDVAEIGVHHGRLFIMLCLAMNAGERAFGLGRGLRFRCPNPDPAVFPFGRGFGRTSGNPDRLYHRRKRSKRLRTDKRVSPA